MNKPVSIITLNYNGKPYLKPLLDSLQNQTYSPLQIIVVENGSSDGSLEYLRENYPDITIVANKDNLGFTGGNNCALEHATGEYVGLINNDVVAAPNYVEELVSALEGHTADIVGGKIVFYTPFVNLRVTVNSFVPSEKGLSGDTRSLGCMLSSDVGFDEMEYKKTLFLENTYGEEEHGDLAYHWVSDNAEIKIPATPGKEQYTLRFRAAVSDHQKEEQMTIELAGKEIFSETLTTEFKEFEVIVDPTLIEQHAHEVINNASSRFDEHSGAGGDVGINEDDNGQYDETKEVQSICGGSMLIRKELLDEYGLFDDYFFAYYEDTDFCWRMKQHGKKLVFAPNAKMNHVHTGTSKEWSPFFRFHVERNRLLMLFKRGKLADVARHWLGFFMKSVKDWSGYIRRKLRGKPHKQLDEIAVVHFNVWKSLIGHLPHLIVKRVRKQ